MIDAFTGDGVPSHLLTSEAMALYFRRLAVRDGLLLVHASTRYSMLFPVVEATARSINLTAIDVITDISSDQPDRDWDPTHTEYIVVCRPEQAKDIAAWFPVDEEKGRVKRLVRTADSPLYDPQYIWTDDRNAALDTLKLGQFLFSP